MRLPLVLASSFVFGLGGCASMRSGAIERSANPAPPGVVRTDLHLHISMDRAARPIFRGHSGGPWISSAPSTVLVNQVDAQALQDAGVRLIFGSVWPPYRLRPGRDARAEGIGQLLQLREFVGATSGFAIAKDAEHAKRLVANGYVTVIPAVEGGEGLTSKDDVDAYFAAGGRVVTLAHFVDNEAAGAAASQIPRALGLKAEDLNEHGLSAVGREIVQRMIELGMIIDLAHASDRTIRDVLDLTEPAGVPVVVSHTAARAWLPTERNLSDELAVRIAKSGGLIAVTIYKGILGPVPANEQLPGHVPGTCDDTIAQWKHFAALVGPEHVTLGTDFNGMAARGPAGGSCPEGLRHVGDLTALYAGLVKHGVPPETIDGGGAKLLELMARAEEKASLAERAKALKTRLPEAPLFASPL